MRNKKSNTEISKMFTEVMTKILLSLHKFSPYITDREIEVLKKLFLEKKSVEQIAEELNLISNRINQIIERTIRRLNVRNHDHYFRYLSNENTTLIFQIESKGMKPKEVWEIICKEKGWDDNIEETDLSVRAINCLKLNGITTIGQITTFKVDDFLKLKNMGKKSLDEVSELLRLKGLSFVK